jgi:site-specific DNA-methyltransferase (adenine-specific)
MINLNLGDCMEAMANMPDNAYDLAIVDPPYGIGMHKQRVYDDGKEWDNTIPNDAYFKELERVSKNQIIWGGNYFPYLWNNGCKGFVIWDKHQPNGLTFAMVELAYTSFNIPAKMFFTKPAGERGFYTVDCKRIHPTQKPVKLYEWLLQNYAKEGDKILDTHGGSMSIAIACHNLGFDLDLWELDEDYYKAGVKRYNNHILQQRLF